MHTHLTQVLDDYARIELKEMALAKGSNRQRIAFLASINKDYEALVKDEEDPSKDSYEE